MPRRKAKKSKKTRTGDLSLGSFSDIAFLLIIYFILATTLAKVTAVTADMPSGETSSETSQEDDTPTILLNGEEVRFKDKLVTWDVLNERLAAMNLKEKQGDKKVILLDSTRETSYDSYFKALAVISTNGGIVAIVEEED